MLLLWQIAIIELTSLEVKYKLIGFRNYVRGVQST